MCVHVSIHVSLYVYELFCYIARRKPLLTAIIVSSASNLPRSTRHGLTKTGKEWYGVMSVNVTCLEVMVGRISGDEYQKSL